MKTPNRFYVVLKDDKEVKGSYGPFESGFAQELAIRLAQTYSHHVIRIVEKEPK